MSRTVSDPRSTLVRWMGFVEANSAGLVSGGTSTEVGVRVEAETPDAGRPGRDVQIRRANRLAEPEQILEQTTVA
jgi:hypothetical protein